MGSRGARWAVAGECIVAWAARMPVGAPLPAGLHRLPGPVAMVGVRFTDSPVGPYLELSVSEPARLGLRPGMCVTTMAVTAPAVAARYRDNWGLPPTVAGLRWLADGDTREIVWEEREVSLRAQPVHAVVPLLVPARGLQRRGDGPVLVPRPFFALTRLARTEVAVPDDDPLSWLAGPHPGAVMAGMRALLRPARTPAGLLSSLRAPRWVPEVAVLHRSPLRPVPKPVQWRPARALSSVG